MPTMRGPSSSSSCLISVLERLVFEQQIKFPPPSLKRFVSSHIPAVLYSKQQQSPLIQGYFYKSRPPLCRQNFIASLRYPPSQLFVPVAFPLALFVHSSAASSERMQLCPYINSLDQQTAVAAKAQQDPQLPWFFTGVTQPLSLQSKQAGSSAPEAPTLPSLVVLYGVPVPRLRVMRLLISEGFSSANSLMAIEQVEFRFYKLWLVIVWHTERKLSYRAFSSSGVQALLYVDLKTSNPTVSQVMLAVLSQGLQSTQDRLKNSSISAFINYIIRRRVLDSCYQSDRAKGLLPLCMQLRGKY